MARENDNNVEVIEKDRRYKDDNYFNGNERNIWLPFFNNHFYFYLFTQLDVLKK
ncbi:hypothetical protein HI031_09480 [Staphylococcus haemolyticus]|nr:hypothetical protein HI031_09480 [Staphylococcus haemolyticus]